MTIKDGRQWATSLAEIRRDHVERYRWAATKLNGLIADIGCGIGYGASILATAGLKVMAIDRSEEALKFGATHWSHKNIEWQCFDVTQWGTAANSAVCFELIEHLPDPKPFLICLTLKAKDGKLLCSVPNEAVMPFDPKRHSYHHRHYTLNQFSDLLYDCGWTVSAWYTQMGKRSPVIPWQHHGAGHDGKGDLGMTLIAECRR